MRKIFVFAVFMIVLVGCAGVPPPEPTIAPTDTVTVTGTVVTETSQTLTPTRTRMVWTQLPSETETRATLTDLPPTITQLSGIVQVSFIDVGQGDAILIKSPEGLFGLIDGGEADSGVVQYLQSQEVQYLDLVVATHPHSDHIGGLIAVLGTFPTARVVTNGEMHTTATYENFLDAIAASKAEYIEVVRGNTLNLGSLTLDVLSPGHIVEGDMNRNAVVLRMAYGNTTFLFTSDVNNDTEAEMIAVGVALKADILKVGHHGSSTSTSETFLAVVHPAIAVYSAGKGNDYGHPSADTLARLGRAGVQILGTDVNGTIVFLVDGTGYTVQTERQGVVLIPPVTTVPAAILVTQVATPVDVSIGVVSLTSPINAGGTAKLTIKTAPGAACLITVYYKSGASEAAGLGPQVADASGLATWSWKVGSRTTKGTWRIVVQCNLIGKTTTLEIPFEVN